MDALYTNITGANNVGLGYQSMYNYKSGNSTAIGYQAMYTNQTGAGATAVGYQALYAGTGASNTAFGSNALKAVTSGTSNIGVGASAGYGTTTGSYNINIGEGTSYSNTAGSNNTVIGYNALMWGTAGSNNTSIGYQAGYRLDGGVGNIFLGANAGPSGFETFSNQLYIANAAGSPLIWGDFSAKKVAINLSTPTSANNTFNVAGSMCVTATGVCTSNTAGTIYTTNTVITGADVAENYVSVQKLQPGDLVSMAENSNSQAVVKASNNSNGTLLGVVSSAPGVTINSEAKTDSIHKYIYPIALSGRVPTKVSTANGSIKIGDALTVGETPGIAVKATQSGYIIGRALESYNSSGTHVIEVYATAGWYSPMQIDGLGNIISDDGTSLANLSSSEQSSLLEKILGVSDKIDGSAHLTERITVMENKIKNLEEYREFVENILASEAEKSISTSDELLQSFDTVNIKNASVSGEILIGSIKITSAENSITSSDIPLKLQTSGTANVDMFNGTITFSSNGDVVTSGTVSVKKINISTEDEEYASIGEGTLLKGEKSVVISTTAVSEKSNIFVTAKTLFSGTLAVTEQKDKESFKVEIEKEAAQDIKFNWWIVN
jgi:hypothetical protein